MNTMSIMRNSRNYKRDHCGQYNSSRVARDEFGGGAGGSSHAVSITRWHPGNEKVVIAIFVEV